MNDISLATLGVVCDKRDLRLLLVTEGERQEAGAKLVALEVRTRGRELVARVPVAAPDRLDEAAEELLAALNRARPFASGLS